MSFPRPSRALVLGLLGVASLVVGAPAIAAPAEALPQLPGDNAVPAAVTPPPAATPATPAKKTKADAKAPLVPDPTESPDYPVNVAANQAKRGVVLVVRGGQPVALGTVLGTDGRVLTSLSALSGADAADIRYADGTSAHTKLGHKDGEWDLALLVPQNGPHWADGLAASEVDPGASELRAFAVGAGKAALASAVTSAPFQGRSDVHAKDGTEIHDALSFEAKRAALGSPVVDAGGRVVALLVRACRNEAAPGSATAANAKAPVAGAAIKCTPITVGAPVAALRNFLIRTPSTAVAPSPWLGIVGETTHAGAVNGVRVVAVAPASPADKTGLKSSQDPDRADVVTAVDGVPVDSPEALSGEIAKHAIGQKIPLLVFKEGKLRQVTVTLTAAP